MKYCKNCQINYNSPIDECLLCHNHLEDDGLNNISNNYPEYKKLKDSNKVIVQISILVNIISMVLTMFINYSISRKIDWSLYVVISNVYIILLFIIVFSKIRTSLKIIYLIILTTLLVIGIGFLTNDYHWAVDIFLPFALIFNTLTLKVIIFSRPKKWRDYIGFLIFSILINMLIVLLNIFNVTITTWAINASLIYGIFTLLAFIIFTPKDLKEEILRRFHV